MKNTLNLYKSEGTMYTSGGIEGLEAIILGKPRGDNTARYSIFLTGAMGEESLPSDYLIELLLIFDSEKYDAETVAYLFEVSLEDVLLFTERYPRYGANWKDSIATKWTKFFNFYEDDLEDLSWISKYAIKRAALAIKMDKTLLEATEEMREELAEDDGWTDDTFILRTEGLIAQDKRAHILQFWLDRSEEEEDHDNSEAT